MLGLAFLTQRIKGQGSCLPAVQGLTQANLWQSMAVVPEQGQTLSWTLCPGLSSAPSLSHDSPWLVPLP